MSSDSDIEGEGNGISGGASADGKGGMGSGDTTPSLCTDDENGGSAPPKQIKSERSKPSHEPRYKSWRPGCLGTLSRDEGSIERADAEVAIDEDAVQAGEEAQTVFHSVTKTMH